MCFKVCKPSVTWYVLSSGNFFYDLEYSSVKFRMKETTLRNLSLEILKLGKHKTRNTLFSVIISRDRGPTYLENFKNGIYRLYMPMVSLLTQNVVKKLLG